MAGKRFFADDKHHERLDQETHPSKGQIRSGGSAKPEGGHRRRADGAVRQNKKSHIEPHSAIGGSATDRSLLGLVSLLNSHSNQSKEEPVRPTLIAPLIVGIVCLQMNGAFGQSQAEATTSGRGSAENAGETPKDQPDESAPDATVQLQAGSFAAGIGFVWGDGTVSFQGSDHQFSIHGVSVVDVGGSKISASGIVLHLHNLADFDGTYVAWTAGATVGAGGSAAYLKNEHGVVLKLLSSTEGLRFNLAGSGVRVRLKT
jgi:hypothetical protein